MLRWLIVWTFEFWSHETCDRIGYIVGSNRLKQVMVGFPTCFHSSVSNGTDDQEAEPDHPRGYINANVKFNTVKKHIRMIVTHEFLLWMLRCTVSGRSTCAPRGCISQKDTTTSPWKQPGLDLCQSNSLIVCPFLTLLPVETQKVALLLNRWSQANQLNRGKCIRVCQVGLLSLRVPRQLSQQQLGLWTRSFPGSRAETSRRAVFIHSTGPMKPKGQDPAQKDIIKNLWNKNLRSVGLLGAKNFWRIYTFEKAAGFLQRRFICRPVGPGARKFLNVINFRPCGFLVNSS